MIEDMDLYLENLLKKQNSVFKKQEITNPLPERDVAKHDTPSPKIVYADHENHNVKFESDYGDLLYNFIDGKLWMAEHGCTFTEEEIANLGQEKIGMLEITLKKLFNAKVAKLTERDHIMLDKNLETV